MFRIVLIPSVYFTIVAFILNMLFPVVLLSFRLAYHQQRATLTEVVRRETQKNITWQRLNCTQHVAPCFISLPVRKTEDL